MSTTYPGSPTATQAPSVPPTPGVVPSVVIPADGDALNAASITQALKALADFEAWLLSPRAKASDWAVPEQLWRSAALHKRFGIDHLGYPMGKLQLWQENWAFTLSITGAGSLVTSATTESGWTFFGQKAGAGGGDVATKIPTTTWPATRFLQIETGDTGGDKAYATRTPPCLFHADVALAMEWDAKLAVLQAYGTGMGFDTATTFISHGHGPIARFRTVNDDSGGNWLCETDDGTTTDLVDSGVPISTAKTRFRIEYHGANVDDAATERVLFFINGALVANMTAKMPSVPASPLASPIFIHTNSGTGGTGGILQMGPVRFGDNLHVDAF